MKITILNEAGHKEAMLGLSLSYNSDTDRANDIAWTLAKKDGGHNNFLESIIVWFDITAPRYWWSQMDRYRLKTQQSESTMHTILKQKLTNDNFEEPLPEQWLNLINTHIENKNLRAVKAVLPESFLQRRIVTVSYKTLRNIYHQRKNHKLKEWQKFCSTIEYGLSHSEYIIH